MVTESSGRGRVKQDLVPGVCQVRGEEPKPGKRILSSETVNDSVTNAVASGVYSSFERARSSPSATIRA